MSIPGEAYATMQSIVGSEWVSDDPAICEADRYCTSAGAPLVAIRPACSIEPASGEEVQAIVRVANRYKLPFIATSTFYFSDTSPKKENTILIDLKRMNRLEIDEDNLYAIVEPGVCFSALQAELLKRGLITFVPGCGGNSSVLANTINMGDAPLGWRYGLGYQRILSAEWVMPDGEMLRLGSRSMSNDFYWGEGPGPDLRGLIRGVAGQQSRLGVVTRLGVKVFPFVSEELEPQGWAFHTFMKLPENRLKWFNIRFWNRDDAIKAIYELGKCEIGLIVMTVPPLFRGIARSRGVGCGGFWEYWNEAGPRINPKQEDLRVLLYGIGSGKRLDYEEKVLLDVVAAYNGLAREAPAMDETNFMAADAICANCVGGRFISEVAYESIDHALKYSRDVSEITDKHRPPILQEYNTTNWICPYELGYIAKMECLRMASVEDGRALLEWKEDCLEACVEGGGWTLFPAPNTFGAAWENYPEKERRFKKVFDPNNVSYPD